MKTSRFRQWQAEETQKLSALPPARKIEYIWDYYKLWIMGILLPVLLLGWGVYHYATVKADNWLFACFANTHAELGEGSAFWEGFADYAGYDLDSKNLVFNAQCYCDPTGNTSGNVYYQTLIAYLESGTLDVLVMEKDRLQVIGAAGRLMDLEGERAIFEQYKERLIYCEPSDTTYGKTSVPIGIDLYGSILVGEGRAYTEDAALGINALATHPEQVEILLAYLFRNEKAVANHSTVY